MTSLWAVSGLGVLASLLWLGMLGALIRHRKSILRLPDLPDDPPEGGWPTVAILFAARDEAPSVERAVRSMLTQDYPALVVIAVDDRSTDGTAEILDRVAAEEERLRVLHVRELPPGWLGKNHALQRAAESTDAEWLLLTDADVMFGRGALRKAIGHALATGADHVTVAPKTPTETVGERLFLAMFQAAFIVGYPIWKVQDDASRKAMGVGAFNLVRAESFRAIGGFGRLALSVDDDMKLGEALKAAGGRSRVLLGGDDVSVKWQSGLGGHIRGLEKNFFAVARFRVAKVVSIALILLWLAAAPHAGLFVGPWWSRALCAAGIAAIAGCLTIFGRQSGIGPWYALTMPLSAALLCVALVRSTWLTLRRGGVRWREHHYPLGELRAHTRRREAWLREVWKSTR